MNQSNSSKQVLLSVIGVAILVVAVVGVSFAFFNYTRTGDVNTVTTGTIQFNSTQSQLNIANAFPIAKSDAVSATAAEHDNVAYSTVTISGKTTYTRGLDFRVTAQAVDLNVASTGTYNVPISVLVTASGNLTAAGSDADAATGDKIFTSNYENGSLANDAVLAVGHISNRDTATAETITIKAFMDSHYIAISDTPQNGSYDQEQPAETGYADTGSNGTTTGWINGRTRLTTTQWNRLATKPATFKIRVESRQTGGTYAYS